ncbi:MAG: carbohydrate ABC transporter permease, partial [bacterium]
MLAVITMIIPMLLMLLFSLYESPELYQSPLEFFKNIPTLTNYADIFITDTFGRYFLNSLFIAFVVTIGNVIFGSMAGYAFARYEFKGKKILFASVMG